MKQIGIRWGLKWRRHSFMSNLKCLQSVLYFVENNNNNNQTQRQRLIGTLWNEDGDFFFLICYSIMTGLVIRKSWPIMICWFSIGLDIDLIIFIATIPLISSNARANEHWTVAINRQWTMNMNQQQTTKWNLQSIYLMQWIERRQQQKVLCNL